MSKKIKRKYKGADYYLQGQSHVIKDLLLVDKTAIIAFDPELDDPFAANFQSAWDLAFTETPSSTIRAQVKGKVEETGKRMEACRDKYREVIFYAAKAFGNNSPVLKEFGRGLAYKKASGGQKYMFDFMNQLSITSNRLKAGLIAKGYTQAKIDDIEIIGAALLDKNSDKNDFKLSRHELTEKRINQLNAVYEKVRKVIAAARMAFKDDGAKLGEYIYRPHIRKRKPKEKKNEE